MKNRILLTLYIQVAASKFQTPWRSGSTLQASTSTSLGVSGQLTHMCKTDSSWVSLRSERTTMQGWQQRWHYRGSSLQNGRMPGIDGLPAEFYKSFWDAIGGDLLEVFSDSLKLGRLTLSCRRAVITLLPIKGDQENIKKRCPCCAWIRKSCPKLWPLDRGRR